MKSCYMEIEVMNLRLFAVIFAVKTEWSVQMRKSVRLSQWRRVQWGAGHLPQWKRKKTLQISRISSEFRRKRNKLQSNSGEVFKILRSNVDNSWNLIACSWFFSQKLSSILNTVDHTYFEHADLFWTSMQGIFWLHLLISLSEDPLWKYKFVFIIL